MNSISSWVLSIAGICLLSVIIDIAMPDGKTNNIIKQVFSYVIILVVILPLPKIVNKNINLDVFEEIEFEIQENFIYNLNQSKLDMWQNNIDNTLNNKGIYGAVVSISANIFEEEMKIKAVYVDLYNTVISEENKNINIKTEVKSVVLSILNIKEENIIFYE